MTEQTKKALYATREDFEKAKKTSPILINEFGLSSQQKVQSLSSSVRTAIKEMLIIGPKGGGKTYVAMYDAVSSLLQLKHHKLRYCIVRLQHSAFLDIVDKIKSLLTTKFKLKEGVDWAFKSSPQDFKFVFLNPRTGTLDGSELLLRAVSNADAYNRLIHGQEYQRFVFDELSLWPNLEVYKLCMSCLRYSAQEDDLDVNEVPLLMRATTNPWELGLEAVWNYFLPENEDSYDKIYTKTIRIGEVEHRETKIAIFSSWIENYKLPANYIPNLIKSVKDNQAKLNAFLRGTPDFSDASFFGEVFNYKKTVFKPFVPPREWARNAKMCYDDGTKSPFAVLWYYKSDGRSFTDWNGESRTVPKNSIFFFYELLGCQPHDETVGLDLTHPEIAKMIKDINDNIIPSKIGNKAQCGVADVAIFQNQRGGGKAGSVAGIFEKLNLVWKKAKKFAGSRRHQAQLWRSGLQATKDNAPDYPHIYISEDCSHLLSQLPRLRRSKADPEDVDNSDEKKIDHLYDAGKGAIDEVVSSRVIENN